jgi:hypothetical protein
LHANGSENANGTERSERGVGRSAGGAEAGEVGHPGATLAGTTSKVIRVI